MTLVRGILIAIVIVVGGLLAFGALQSAPPGHGGFALVRSVPGPEAELWAVGDGDASPDGRSVVNMLLASRFDRLLYLGDVYTHGKAVEFRANYVPSYGRLARMTAPTPGNHDWPNHESGYDRYWSTALGRSRTSSWYGFYAGGWQILSLNSEAAHERGSPQERWLRRRLSGPGTCTLAFWHRPRYSAGKHGDQDDVAPLWEALRGHAAIVLNGHDHDMQRLRPIDGITEFVSGAGGRSLYGVDASDRRLAFSNDHSHGALRLRLRRGLASYAFISTTGRLQDSGRVRCRPGRQRY
ncbi:MAG TPA: metallophosphoesterase [Solirubrobacteraceae bacterium]